MNKERELEKLHQEIKSCKKCPLWGTRKNAVPGEGPANAKIILLGQAPGAMENLKGIPFCGRAGKFLDYLLKIARIDRKKSLLPVQLNAFLQEIENQKRKKLKLVCLI